MESPRSAFERRLTREILVSEKLRVQLLVAIPAAALILFLALTAMNPVAIEQAFASKLDRVRVGLLLGGFAAYELLALRAVEKLLETDREPPALRRYVNALVETSLPTLVTLYYLTVVSPVEALLLPPVFIYFVFILLSTLRLEFKLCLFTGAVAAVEYALLAGIVVLDGEDRFSHPVLASLPHHMGKAAILLVSGVAAGFVARRLRSGFVKTLESIEERNRVVSVFGQHVSPAVVDQLLRERADMKSELRDVCVMFVDVRGFTAFSEGRTPEEVVGYLNKLFEHMIDSVNKHQGIVNKFLGDGFMAVFGAPLADPDFCRHAVESAAEILARLDELIVTGAVPPTRVGIGIHAGRAVLGNVGSVDRKEYTVMGDVVNVASRIETLTKEHQTQLFMTDRVWELAGRPGGVVTLPAVAIRGRQEPLVLHKLPDGAALVLGEEPAMTDPALPN